MKETQLTLTSTGLMKNKSRQNGKTKFLSEGMAITTGMKIETKIGTRIPTQIETRIGIRIETIIEIRIETRTTIKIEMKTLTQIETKIEIEEMRENKKSRDKLKSGVGMVVGVRNGLGTGTTPTMMKTGATTKKIITTKSQTTDTQSASNVLKAAKSAQHLINARNVTSILIL